jgi:hypothetical protein
MEVVLHLAASTIRKLGVIGTVLAFIKEFN